MRVREVRFLIAAAVLHGAIPVLAAVSPRAERLSARSSGAYREVEVEVREVAPLSPPPSAPRARVDPEREAEPETEPRTRREHARKGPATAVEPSGSEVPESPEVAQPVAPEAPGPPPDEYGGPPPPDGVLTAPGLAGRPVWEMPGVLPQRAPQAAPTRAPPERAVSADKAGEVLRQAMQAKDKSIGLDLPAAGTVASVIADTVRASDTPDVARATFEVRLSAAGQVVGVRVVSSSAGGVDAWARAARAAASRLAGRAFAMTSAFAKGAIVRVSIVSSQKMPSGSDTGGVQLQGTGFGFDVSDIGAHAVRVVSSSFRVVAVD